MAISVQWLDNDHRVLYRHLDGKWTWAEFYESHDALVKMMESVSHPVHLLIRVSNISTLAIPSGLLTHGQKSLMAFPDNLDTIVVVNNNRFIYSIVSVMKNIVPKKVVKEIKMVTSLEDAYELLAIAPNAPIA